MKRVLAALFAIAGCLANASAKADCAQSVFEVPVNPLVSYGVGHTFSDNNVEVFVNGRLVQVWRSTDSFKPPVDLTALFSKQRTNTVRIHGTNEAYRKGWHDPNPGDTGYDLWFVTSYRCKIDDWRGEWPLQMFDHTYSFIDQRYPGPAVVAKARKPNSDPRLARQEFRMF
ncbi:hypothetical protein CV770_18465 [Bradyrhizobium sp. AC87j1]|uniref:hypothetical protein n=1 Tax=Bradyrhizobium sp. AC87j1 TaxID=2055894 RepID=UPI000D3F065C|nr:hypothetical protein [Bradyrhizobium sp. AC87j1]PPQ17951.1 hypothetical protein CV770_18465 [Bradyrhizobium sp. AC87j1]